MGFEEFPPHVASVIQDCIEIRLKTPDDFLKVKETLTRIGIASPKDRKLVQSAHILHKRGRYYLVSYKELFLLDGKTEQTEFTENDKARRNTIANLLADWGLVVLVDPAHSATPVVPTSQITIIPFREKAEWTSIAKYDIGKRRG